MAMHFPKSKKQSSYFSSVSIKILSVSQPESWRTEHGMCLLNLAVVNMVQNFGL